MKNVILILCLLVFSCKNKSEHQIKGGENQSVTQEAKDPLDRIEEIQQRDLENAYFYVLAPNGLSLRESEDLNSQRILTIPLGEKVKQIGAVFTVDMTIENIPGSMIEVSYKDKKGYVFSGFLSRYLLPNNEKETKDYIAALKEIEPDVMFEERPTDPDFHQGNIQTITLPKTEWSEVFYIAKAKYNIPKSLLFPGHKGVKKETIEQVDKDKQVWASDLFISRNLNRLDTIKYNWRAEGSGYWVLITEPERNKLRIEFTGFAD